MNFGVFTMLTNLVGAGSAKPAFLVWILGPQRVLGFQPIELDFWVSKACQVGSVVLLKSY
jgi:hypothetical protein